ncbi:hypothetical protein BGY98DRAFT_376491 [Russula aff. rugulosa BPL654]|nr:hypothetical protein BGY98DRAFT_376491 [Russula aff. rugulosa BPL654]
MHTDGRSNVYCKRTKNLFPATVTASIWSGFYIQLDWTWRCSTGQIIESMRRETEIGTTRTGVDGGDPNVPLCIEVGQLPALAAVPRGLDVVCAANSREAGNILKVGNSVARILHFVPSVAVLSLSYLVSSMAVVGKTSCSSSYIESYMSSGEVTLPHAGTARAACARRSVKMNVVK